MIAHRLRCLTTLHYLNQYFEQHSTRIKAGVFVSGFKSSLPTQPELTAFIQRAKMDSGVLQTYMPICISLISSNDPIGAATGCDPIGQFYKCTNL